MQMQVLAPWTDSKTKKTTLEPAKIKCIFKGTGTATVAWSDGTKPSKISQKVIDITQPDVANKRHADFTTDANAGDGDGDEESDLGLESDDNDDEPDDEPAKKRSRGKRKQKQKV